MADGGERRMLFDIRGRRKHVVRVVYAILALLMGASLFLVVGPFNIGNLVGNSNSTSASKVLTEQAERIEEKLIRDPKNEALLLALTRTWLSAANSATEIDPETGVTFFTAEGQQDLDRGTQAWALYMKQAKEPKASAALLAARSYFGLAESSTGIEEIEEEVAKAANAQRVAAELQPTINSLTTLAIYEFYNGDFAAGDKATKQATAKATTKEEAKEIKKQMAEFRKRGKAFATQKKLFEKEAKTIGKERLENPLEGLGGSSGGLGG